MRGYEVLIDRDRYASRTNIVIHAPDAASQEAAFAFASIERWGMVAGVPDGEDSSGKSKLRLATPEELVERAFKVSALAFATAREKGLMINLPSEKEMDEIIKTRENKKENK